MVEKQINYIVICGMTKTYIIVSFIFSTFVNVAKMFEPYLYIFVTLSTDVPQVKTEPFIPLSRLIPQ